MISKIISHIRFAGFLRDPYNILGDHGENSTRVCDVFESIPKFGSSHLRK